MTADELLLLVEIPDLCMVSGLFSANTLGAHSLLGFLDSFSANFFVEFV